MFAYAGLSPKLLAVSPHDRGSRFEPNANSAPVVGIGALGGNTPDDIFGGQNRRHCCHLDT